MLSKYLTVDYTDEIRESLILKSFWELVEPSDWTAANYLTKLYEQNQTLAKHYAHRYLIKDVNTLKKLIIPGTVAETMLLTLSKFNETKANKKALQKFYEVAAEKIKTSGLKQKSAKSSLKSSMMEEIAFEEEERVKKMSKTSAVSSSSGDGVFRMPSDDNDEAEASSNDLSQSWKEFIDESLNSSHLPSLSPERHGVIWFGHNLHRRQHISKVLYNQMKQETDEIKQHQFSDIFKEPIKKIIESTNRIQMLDSIDALRCINNTSSESKLLVDLFTLFGEQVYDDVGATFVEAEACLNSYLVNPCLQSCVRMLRCEAHNVTYLPAGVELTSMTVQLTKQGLLDNRFKYLVDGKIRINTDKQELLIVEVSSALGQASREKVGFDHSKAMFGMLVILKTLAEKYNHASFETFKKIKIHFIHAFDHMVRHWSMSTPIPGVYVMNREQRTTIPVEFDQMGDELLPFVLFHFNLTNSLRETIHSIVELREEHREELQASMLANQKPHEKTLLSTQVNPIVIRLNEKKHTKEVEESPRSCSASPKR